MEKSTKHILRRMDQTGDSVVVTWDVVEAAEKVLAEEKFKELSDRGYAAFDLSTDTPAQIREFNPEAKDILMTPPLRGG